MKCYIKLKINDNVRYEKDALILIYTYLFFFRFSFFPLSCQSCNYYIVNYYCLFIKAFCVSQHFFRVRFIMTRIQLPISNEFQSWWKCIYFFFFFFFLESGNYRTVGFQFGLITISNNCFAIWLLQVNQDASD